MDRRTTNPTRATSRHRRGRAAAWSMAAVLLQAATGTAQPEPNGTSPAASPDTFSAEQPVLRVGACESLPPERLADALSARLGRLVETTQAASSSAAVWLVELHPGENGIVLHLRDPAGVRWLRDVDLPADAPESDRARTAALAAEYLLALAHSPFVSPGEDRVAPEPPTTPALTTPAEPDASGEAPVVPETPAPPPSGGREGAEPEPSTPVLSPRAPGGRLDASLLLGGSADLSYVTRGRSGALDLGLRAELEWPGGLWLLVEAEWHYAAAEDPEPVALHQLPVRVGAGGAVQVERATFRLGLEGVFEAWWSTGGTPRSDWRSGGGLLLSGGYRLTPWLAVGGDLGVELLPHGVELIYGDTPVFSLGPWRWRGLAWLSVGADLGL